MRKLATLVFALILSGVVYGAEPEKATSDVLRERKARFEAEVNQFRAQMNMLPFLIADREQAIARIDEELKAREKTEPKKK